MTANFIRVFLFLLLAAALVGGEFSRALLIFLVMGVAEGILAVSAWAVKRAAKSDPKAK